MREYTAMAASTRLVFTSSLFRIRQSILLTSPTPSLCKPLVRNFSISNHLPVRLPLQQFTKLTPALSYLRTSLNPHLFRKYTTSSAATDIDDILTPDSETEAEVTPPISSSSASSHPWPEWVTFVGKLKSKGYFDDSLTLTEADEDEDDGDGDGDGSDDGIVIGTSRKDLHVLKHGFLKFARERFDIFKSLSKEHIQTIVECGCPSVNRKDVNSAKRLRATLRIDEGDVCSACILRGSCDRAYGILKDNEASARTVDIVRMLLMYANPLLLSKGEKPHGRENVEASARKLLSELSVLSETALDPSLPKPAVRPPKLKEMNHMGKDSSQNVEMKRGDWICSSCNFMNFARNLRCLECKAEGPKRVSVNDVEMKKGDWNCPQCSFMNFARNTNCLQCRGSRPKRELLPGEWECPSCDFLNYRRNTECLKCNCDGPNDKVAEYEDQIWRKPR